MKRLLWVLLVLIFIVTISCSTIGPKTFADLTPEEKIITTIGVVVTGVYIGTVTYWVVTADNVSWQNLYSQ